MVGELYTHTCLRVKRMVVLPIDFLTCFFLSCSFIMHFFYKTVAGKLSFHALLLLPCYFSHCHNTSSMIFDTCQNSLYHILHPNISHMTIIQCIFSYINYSQFYSPSGVHHSCFCALRTEYIQLVTLLLLTAM
jgi:hypothetical protein